METLEWLADNSRYTKQFANYVGKLCRDMTNKAVAETLNLHEDTVKDLDKMYMKQMLVKAPIAAPSVIGIDELSIRKGHTYRIIVSDIERGRPIWIGGAGRKEEDMDLFFAFLGEKKTKKIRLAVMDMWKAFYNSVTHYAPKADILFDKFHILNHLSKAMDQVRRDEYKRVSGEERSYIKGQRYTLLAHPENLTLEGRKGLRKLLAANKRIQVAYLLKEEFYQMWDYKSEGWARRFFENWKDQLKWQRLKPFEKFSNMIENHWEGIASYCCHENKVKLGFVEGVNNKVRVIQRSAYGFRDEEYLKLKILTAFLPKNL
jgi:transposase